MSPICQYSAIDGSANDWHLQHLASLSLSGAGVVIFECLTGERPTEAENLGQVLKKVLSANFPSLAEKFPGCPEDLAELRAAIELPNLNVSELGTDAYATVGAAFDTARRQLVEH